MIWLYFEKNFLFPTLSSGNKLTKAVMTSLTSTVQPPSFVKNKSRARYNATLMMYWRQTCASRCFEVLATEESGFYVLCKTNNYKMLQKAFIGHCVHLDRRHGYFLNSAGYNSLFKCNDGSVCVLYGPLQFANHDCSSHLKIKLKRNKSFHFIHEYDEEFDPKELVLCNQELLLSYVCKAELWFDCKCSTCT